MELILETTNAAGIPVVYYGRQYSAQSVSLINCRDDIQQPFRCVVDTGCDAIEVYCFDTLTEAEDKAQEVLNERAKASKKPGDYPRAHVKEIRLTEGA